MSLLKIPRSINSKFKERIIQVALGCILGAEYTPMPLVWLVFLKKNTSHTSGIRTLVSNCKSGMREIPIVQIQRCYREANKCGDTLTRRGALLSQDFVIFLEPPAEVLFLLSLDVTGVYYENFASAA